MATKIDIAQKKPQTVTRSSYLDNYIGQETVIKKMKFFVQSHSLETPFPTVLLTGSHGLGKTFLAEKLAKSLGRKFIAVNSGMIKKRDDFFKDVISQIHSPTTIFFDESHQLNSEMTTILLTLLNPTADHRNTFSHMGVEFVYDLRFVNLIFATTDAHMMFRPLRNRCYSVYFSPYEQKDLIAILQLYLGYTQLACSHQELSDACRSRARNAYQLAQNIKRYANLNKLNTITTKDWEDIKNIFDIQWRGLTSEEVKLLRIIKDHGPISCSSLALILMVNENNIKSELEVRLKELNLIKNSSKGREITTKGLRYFQESDMPAELF